MPKSRASWHLASLNLLNYAEPPAAYYDAENIYSPEQWQRKQAWTSQLISQMAPDVLALQEVFSPASLQALCKQCGLAYFATVDTPQAELEFVYRKPVVALASRFPIEQVCAVSATADVRSALELPTQATDFSRPPLRALLRLPELGLLRVYVVHLKSPRPIWQENSVMLSSEPQQQRGLDQLILQSRLGAWAAIRQRGNEAAMLMADVVQQQLAQPLPTVILGDFNDELNAAPLSALTQPNSSLSQAGLTLQASTELKQRFELMDAFALSQEKSQPWPTHYWGESGRRLDHILCSAEFDPGYRFNLAQIDRVEVYDQHLRRPDNLTDLQASDHAGLVAQFSARL